MQSARQTDRRNQANECMNSDFGWLPSFSTMQRKSTKKQIHATRVLSRVDHRDKNKTSSERNKIRRDKNKNEV